MSITFINQFFQSLMSPRQVLLRRSLLAVSIRVLLASAGWYITVSTWTAALAVTLPLGGADSVILATMLAFLLFTFGVLLSFKVQRISRLLWAMLVANIVPLAVLYMTGSL